MDKERRSRLKSVVGRARRVVEEDVKVQLRRLGIDENEIKPVEKLPHLSAADKELRQRIVEALEKEKAGDISFGEAFGRYVRHVGFTYVNRIAALRAMEVRNLIKETVIRRDVYGGRSRREYELAERERFSDPYELLKAGLVEAFDEVSAEIRVLFDVNSEYSLVFLGHKALLELVRLLGEEVPEEDWKEDDVIGWIYQYYNEEARAEFKKAKRKPKADDIPVINQFYTPRWVVRVLVDNTLGRLWLEMNGRCPKLGDPIKRTKEQLDNPSGDTVDEFCSYLVPLSQEPPPREKKSVREIKVLDPACGSGHFLVYAFDVLFRMYREAEPDTPVEEIPRLILENNLFGIDIDLRAVQLAALSLYLKAKSYNTKLKVTKMNLVCADARITDGKVRKVFLERFPDDPELQMIFAKLFENLEYTYEIGSLLKVREPFEKLLERRRREAGVQAVLVPRIEGQTAISMSGKIEGQTKLSMKVVEDKKAVQIIAIPKEVTLGHMLSALKEFEKEAMEKRDMGTLLFATEAEKSVGLLGILSEKYDVILMNPAYGDMPMKTKEYVEKYFPRTKHDYYAAFIEQTVDLAESNGFVGMLTSRTFMFLRSFLTLREDILWNEALPELIVDNGSGVLDGATVETATTVIRKILETQSDLPTEKRECTFSRLTMFDTYKKEKAFSDSFCVYLEDREHELWFRTKFSDLAQIPGTTYAYWASPSLRVLFTKYPPLDRDITAKTKEEKIADVKVGLQTGDDKRFIRQFWEVPQNNIGYGKKWVPFAKGGEFAKFYADVDMVLNWKNNGEEIRGFPNAYIRNEQLYFREGLTYGYISITGFAIRYLPKGCISGHAERTIHGNFDPWNMLGCLSSKLFHVLKVMQNPDRKWEQAYTAPLPINKTCLSQKILATLSREAHDLLQEWNTGNETSTIFVKPWILQVLHDHNPMEKPITGHPFTEQFVWSDWSSLKDIRAISASKTTHLRELSLLALKREEKIQKRTEKLQGLIDEEVYRIYGISKEDKELIEKELALQRGEPTSFDSETEKEEEQTESQLDIEAKVKNHLARLVSFYIKNTLESDPDAILPFHELINNVRRCLTNDFGKEKVDEKEREIKEILGKSLEEWIVTEYFDFHVNLYKRRPVFWHLTSSNFSTARGSIGAINIFLYYHKLDRDAIPKILTKYLNPELEAAKWKTERLKRELQEARDQGNRTKEKELSNQLENAASLLEELQSFQKALETVHNPRPDETKLPKNPTWVQQRIAEIRDNGYNPVIDYGVRVNIEPLKEAGLLHKAAQRVK